MQSPDRGAVRLVRAGAVALTVVALASAAHVAGGAQLPPPLLLAALAALTACGAFTLTGRRLSVPALLAVLAGGQGALHAGLRALAADTVAVPAHGHHQGWVPLVAEAAGHAGGGSPLPMLLAHAVATTAAALVLARGERAVWSLWAWLQPLRVVVLAVLRVPVLRPVAPVPVTVRVRPRSVVARRVARRGPPAGSVPATTTC
ncbi:hypothetical protein [Kineococcus indalonis]|uniref:hypothetical protein n=1 Tax=Kineococcus indalonis TaxID=2696566 RepID=UPI0014130A2A|nr:hypothetical protein [Kineococcus indalonis]NAZ88508.1 hypothetical protein [Kineococcus indalonis]